MWPLINWKEGHSGITEWTSLLHYNSYAISQSSLAHFLAVILFQRDSIPAALDPELPADRQLEMRRAARSNTFPSPSIMSSAAVKWPCKVPAAVPYLSSSDERSVLPAVLPLVLSTALLARARWYSVAAGLGDLAQATHTNATPANGSGDQERREGIGSPLHHSGPIDRQS